MSVQGASPQPGVSGDCPWQPQPADLWGWGGGGPGGDPLVSGGLGQEAQEQLRSYTFENENKLGEEMQMLGLEEAPPVFQDLLPTLPMPQEDEEAPSALREVVDEAMPLQDPEVSEDSQLGPAVAPELVAPPSSMSDHYVLYQAWMSSISGAQPSFGLLPKALEEPPSNFLSPASSPCHQSPLDPHSHLSPASSPREPPLDFHLSSPASPPSPPEPLIYPHAHPSPADTGYGGSPMSQATVASDLDDPDDPSDLDDPDDPDDPDYEATIPSPPSPPRQKRAPARVGKEANVKKGAGRAKKDAGRAKKGAATIPKKDAGRVKKEAATISKKDAGKTRGLYGRKGCCPICGGEPKTRLDRHMIRAHGNRKFPCEHCGKMFNQKVLLDRHVETNHSEKRDGFKCVTCGKVLSRKDKLKEHETNMHPVSGVSRRRGNHQH